MYIFVFLSSGTSGSYVLDKNGNFRKKQGVWFNEHGPINPTEADLKSLEKTKGNNMKLKRGRKLTKKEILEKQKKMEKFIEDGRRIIQEKARPKEEKEKKELKGRMEFYIEKEQEERRKKEQELLKKIAEFKDSDFEEAAKNIQKQMSGLYEEAIINAYLGYLRWILMFCLKEGR